MDAKLIKSPGFQKGGQGMSPHCLIKAHLEITFTQTPHTPSPPNRSVSYQSCLCHTPQIQVFTEVKLPSLPFVQVPWHVPERQREGKDVKDESGAEG